MFEWEREISIGGCTRLEPRPKITLGWLDSSASGGSANLMDGLQVRAAQTPKTEMDAQCHRSKKDRLKATDMRDLDRRIRGGTTTVNWPHFHHVERFSSAPRLLMFSRIYRGAVERVVVRVARKPRPRSHPRRGTSKPVAVAAARPNGKRKTGILCGFPTFFGLAPVGPLHQTGPLMHLGSAGPCV